MVSGKAATLNRVMSPPLDQYIPPRTLATLYPIVPGRGSPRRLLPEEA